MKKVPVTLDESNFYIHAGDDDDSTPAIINPILDEFAPELDKIQAFGKLKYSKDRIAAALDMSKTKLEIFFRHFDDPTSDERIAYEKGLTLGDAEIDIGLTNAARDGDSWSAKELLVRQHKRKMEGLKKELFNL